MRILRRMPVTIGLVAILLIVAFATGPIGGPSKVLRHLVGLELGTIARREWWSLLTADFFVDNLAQLVIVVVAAALGVGAAERLMGSRRTILAFVVTGVAGSALGLAAQAIGVLAGEYWADSVRSLVTIDPLTPILGTVVVASAFASVLWRRRIRVVVLATVVVFLLYSGQPSDLYRLIAVLVGLALGALLSRRRVRLERWTSSHHETRVLLATLAAIFALGPVITLVSHGRFGLLSPLGVFNTDGMPRSRPCAVDQASALCSQQLGSHAGQGISALVLALVPLVIVLVGAYGLYLGRRAAVYLVAALAAADGLLAAFYFGVLPAIGQASHVAHHAGRSPEFGAWMAANAVLPIAFAVLVLSQRRHFTVLAAPRARRRFVITVALGAVGISVAYLGVGWALRGQFKPIVDLGDLLFDLPERFIPVSYLIAERHDFVPESFATRLLFHGVGPLLWITVLVALLMLLRDARSTGSSQAEKNEFRALLRQSGDSMSFPGTWTGNSYWFNADRTAAIAYRVTNGCAVTTGAPVGRPEDARDTLVQFIRFCDLNAWTPVFYSVQEEWATALTELGWSTTVVAEETVIDPAGWEMTGKKWQDVRSSVNRAARQGVRVTWSTWAALSSRTANQVAEISELWVVEKKLPELGFTLGGLDELRDPDVLLGIASDEDGTVQAVTSWMPSWRDGELVGYTLDFMRRRADGMNGVMEFVIAEAALRAKLEGLEFLSLSGAPLAVMPTDDKPAPLDRVLAMVGRSLEPVYGFRSLLQFKQKFQPRLEPLYLAYPDALSLPAIAIAISRCYLPDLDLRETATLVRSLR